MSHRVNRKLHFSLRYYIISFLLLGTPVYNTCYQYYSPLVYSPITIVLDPAGDAQTPGRSIDTAFERGITLQFAEKLKQVITNAYPMVRVVISRTSGQSLDELHNANLANRLDAALYLHINFYQEMAAKPTAALYVFSYGNEFITTMQEHYFCPLEKAYLFKHHTSVELAHALKKILEDQQYHSSFDMIGIYTIPCKPLLGIKCPAIALEGGLKQASDYMAYLEPVAQFLYQYIEQKIAQS